MTKKGYKQTQDHIQKRVDNRRKTHPQWFSNKDFFNSREYKEKMSEALSGENNPRYGVALSNELKDKISASERRTKGGTVKNLIKSIRKLGKYKRWKKQILLRDCGTINVKNIQIHHLIPLKIFLKERKIETLEQAIECDDLWDVSLGVALRKGEHFLISRIERQKRVSKGFILLLKKWLALKEDTAKELDRKEKE